VITIKELAMGRVVAFAIGIVLTACSCGAGGSSSGGTSGGGTATVDLTFSGDLTGQSTQVAKRDCPNPDDSAAIHTFVMELDPVLNGNTLTLTIAAGKYNGPGTLLMHGGGLMVNLEDKGHNRVWYQSAETTGSVVINSDRISGRIDVHGLVNTGLPPKSVDVTGTFTCPPGK
jgi:hypothetical protein